MLFLRDIDADVQLRCCACGHGGVLPRAMLERRFGPNYPVLSIAPHYRCSRCDSRDTESRPIVAESPAAANGEPSFDAPLAALNGLLASLRGGPGNAEPEAPRGKPGHPLSNLPLSDLVADGPAGDGADPLWEPVSLADMAARLGDARPSDEDAAGWDDLPAEAPVRRISKAAAAAAADEDEALTAMRRLLDQADWADEAPEERDAGRNGPRMPDAADGPFDDGVSDGEDAGEEPPAAFSHKMLVRNDFEDEAADEDFASWRSIVAGGVPDEPEMDDPEDDPEDEHGDDGYGEDEPSDDDILSFAIRDPERPAPRPDGPVGRPPAQRPHASEPLDFDQHRAERRAQRPPPPPEDEGGFDRTLAALRSMIEDAANDPDDEAPPMPRKTRGAGKAADKTAGKAAGRGEADREDGESLRPGRDAAEDGRPVAKADPEPEEPSPEPAPSGRRSAQEREIEEAMRALRGLIEEEMPLELPAPSPPPPPAPSKARTGKQRPPALPEPTMTEDDVPPHDGKPAAEPTPLSKTIAALRGMLELDGRRKR
ncbi:hypothetical protein ABMY26_14220 [Azospirillum sp. HJ39]|uniref:hypothetical protein n=1 Tax=Azospirillum sp. HJ39 TaxID=3159496 RepID=UPI003556C2AF